MGKKEKIDFVRYTIKANRKKLNILDPIELSDEDCLEIYEKILPEIKEVIEDYYNLAAQ